MDDEQAHEGDPTDAPRDDRREKDGDLLERVADGGTRQAVLDFCAATASRGVPDLPDPAHDDVSWVADAA